MTADVIRFLCPRLRCRAILSVPESARGKDVRCKQCGARIKIPASVNPDEKGAANQGSTQKLPKK